MKKLQAEHAAWLAVKYPNQPPEIPAMGCLEEAGELVHAVLKMEQVRVWGEDSRYKVADLRAKLVDAVGDCGIYACSLCNANGWDFEELFTLPEYIEGEEDAKRHVISFVQSAVNVAFDPTDRSCIEYYVILLQGLAKRFGLDIETSVRTTWEQVRAR